MKKSLIFSVALMLAAVTQFGCDEGAKDILKSFKSTKCEVSKYVPRCVQDGVGLVSCGTDGKTVLTECKDNTVCRKDEQGNVACIEKCKVFCTGNFLNKCDENGKPISVDCGKENKVCESGACVTKQEGA